MCQKINADALIIIPHKRSSWHLRPPAVYVTHIPAIPAIPSDRDRADSKRNNNNNNTTVCARRVHESYPSRRRRYEHLKHTLDRIKIALGMYRVPAEGAASIVAACAPIKYLAASQVEGSRTP